MHKTIFLIAFLLLPLGGCTPKAEAPPELPQGWKWHRDHVRNFGVAYPGEWSFRSSEETPIAMTAHNNSELGVLCDVQLMEAPERQNPPTAAEIESLNDDKSLLEGLERNILRPSLLESKAVSLGGQNALLMVSDVELGAAGSHREIMVGTWRFGMLFFLGCASEVSQYKETKKVFNQMMGSFRFY